MSDELRDQMESLRSLAPRLNGITDQATAAIRAADEFLGGLGIGVTALSGCFMEKGGADSEDEESAKDKIRWYLAYGRCYFSDNKFSIHVRVDTERPDSRWADCWDTIDETVSQWSNLSRGDKLKAFAQIPRLLENIAKEATKLVADSEKTHATVSELMASLAIATPGTGEVHVKPTSDQDAFFAESARILNERHSEARAQQEANSSTLANLTRAGHVGGSPIDSPNPSAPKPLASRRRRR